jgi:uncharacterized protein (TIGR01619 family)
MSDNWDFYFAQVDGHAASIFVDLGRAADAPDPTRGAMVHLRLQLRDPGPRGLSSDSEFDALLEVEDALARLEASTGAVYVGRNTCAGARDFYFYAPTAENWSKQVDAFMRAFPAYRYECGGRADPRWSVYFDFLHPSEEDLQRIHNRRVCDSLANHGDALEVARPIDHFIYFSDEAARAAYAEAVTELGCRIEEHLEPKDVDARLGLRITNVGVPSLAQIDALTLPLWRLAREHGGDYDGWGCHAVK